MATDHEEGKEGEDSRAVEAVDAVAERHDATQLAKGSEQTVDVDRDRDNAVAVDEVPPASHILCRPTSSSRIPSSQVTSPRTQPLLNSCSSNSHSNSSSNSQCSNSSPRMIDTAHHPQPAAHVANKNSTSNNSNSQEASAKAVGRGKEGSKDIRWPMRSSKRTLRPRKTSPAPSSSISQMKAARSHFPSGVAMDRVKSARAARNVRKSGSLNAHPAS